MSEKVIGGAVRISESDVRNRYIPLLHVIDMFPPDCMGGDDGSIEPGVPVTLHFDKVGTIETDLYRTKKTPRKTGLVRDFYERGNAEGGSRLFIERLGRREFRITVIN